MKAYHSHNAENTYVGTFGGEFVDDSIDIDEYGIQIGDFSISEIPASLFKSLAVQMVNHLIQNGHEFSFFQEHGDFHKRLRANK